MEKTKRDPRKIEDWLDHPESCCFCGRPGSSGECYIGPLDTELSEDIRCPICGYFPAGVDRALDEAGNLR